MQPGHAGRQIHEQHVERAPCHVAQQLAQGRRFQRAAPDERVAPGPFERQRLAVLQQVRHRHAAYAVRARHRLHSAGGNGERASGVEQARQRGTVQVGVQRAHPPAGSRQRPREERRDEALADASLAAHHGDDAVYRREPLGHAPVLGADLLAQA